VDSGNVRTFKVCNTLACAPASLSTLSTVTATALKVELISPSTSITRRSTGPVADGLGKLRSVFDTRLYETDTLAFSRESDIDNTAW